MEIVRLPYDSRSAMSRILDNGQVLQIAYHHLWALADSRVQRDLEMLLFPWTISRPAR